MAAQHPLTGVGLGVAVYGAAVLQLAFAGESGPQYLLIVAASWLQRATPSRGVAGVAGIGLVIDLVSHHRLGLHLATCGVLAATASSCLTETQRRSVWSLPFVTGGLVIGDALVSRTLLAIQRGEVVPLPTLVGQGAWCAVWSAMLVTGLLVVGDLVRRYVQPLQMSYVPHLTNSWAGLNERD